ncbi:hypothetical protein QUB36_16130 [Microcoleus sp. AT8-B1]
MFPIPHFHLAIPNFAQGLKVTSPRLGKGWGDVYSNSQVNEV